ncbi:hypothetical protein [Rhodococcus sp. WB1]|uniref:hypothetical protein n=1 Tax=Rhodococcus sp. WB1 TaxID=1033922 RepID=UPI001E55525A|nr:hypothetical protein [Rhodococcus sp. WB1]
MTVLLFAVLGAAAGAGAHRLVARLAGRHPPRGVCEAAAAAAAPWPCSPPPRHRVRPPSRR